MQTLGVAPASTSWRVARKVGWWRMERSTESLDFQDWTIDGVPLRDLASHRGPDPVPHEPVQEMTWLSEEAPAAAVQHLQRLLGQQPGDFPDGRVSVLVCPIDADIGCGAVSVELIMDADTVHWRNLAWENDYEPLDLARDLLRPPQSYQFRRDDYTELLSGLLAHYEGLADSQPPPLA